ncbi:MAG TPA: bacterial proteasome activator family protein [Nocardioidaceae bacterium]
MTEENPEAAGIDEEPRVVVIGPDGMASSEAGLSPDGDDDEETRHITELVEQPAKVMRIGSMIRQLLEEVKSAPLDEASRQRLKEIHESSIKELEAGLAPELIEELERLSLPFTEATPSEAELRIAQAQLVGWLEGLFHGIQTAIYAQQVAARAQLEQMRRALPPGMMPEEAMQAAARAAQQAAAQQAADEQHQGRGGGMYL